MSAKLKFGPTISPVQGKGQRVVCFTATPAEVTQIARVQRIGRDGKGRLSGFQRPQIASHIKEIRDYLSQPGAMLPNAIVLAFSEGASVGKDGYLSIDVSEGPPGWVVDGQQRLCAALEIPNRKFQFIVSAFICDDRKELNRQFILVNNTRPLAKPLIYELLPGVEGLPQRLSDRSGAALLVEALNYGRDSSLKGQIHQQTNPEGVLKDTLVQRMLISSLQHGALRELDGTKALLSEGASLVSEFFAAVQDVFSEDWNEHTAKTSRLLHGVGLVSMGYVMDELVHRVQARSSAEFKAGLRPLVGRVHWTKGEWEIGNERRAWNTLQNTAADYRLISHYLLRIVRRANGRIGAAA
jgi:DGQHR domain-containing protein